MLRQDLLHHLRMMRRKPGFTLVAVLSLALGIAANTTIFSILSGTLLDPVRLDEPERIVYLSTFELDDPEQENWVAVPEYKDWKEQARSFEIMGAMFGSTQGRILGAANDGAPAELLSAFALERDLLDVWRIRPLLGRLFTADEDRVGEPASVALISHRFWLRRFEGNPNVLGQTLVLDGSPATVIGVMPQGLSETLLRPEMDLWIPWSLAPSMVVSASRFNHVYARLKPGVTIAQAQAEMDALAAQRAQAFPDTNAGWGVRVQSLQDFFFGDLREPLLLLQGAVALVLLIACANVAVLLLAAATSRQTEVALRNAIGASRTRIVRQMLTESLLLASLGGALGLLLAWIGTRVFVAVSPAWFPGLERIEIDGGVLGFTVAIVAATSVMFGLVPALSSSRPDLSGLLNETPRGSSGGGARKRLRLALVTGQTALALILLIGAGLLINSFLRLEDNPLGGDPEGVLSFRLSFSQDEGIAFTGRQFEGVGLWSTNPVVPRTLERVLERLESVPGVESVTGSYNLPFGGALSIPFRREGQAAATQGERDANFAANYVSTTPGYFDLLRVPILRGRDFTDRDRGGSQYVAIVNEAMARRYWPGEDPLGRSLTLEHVPDEPSRMIVGVVGDMLLNRFEQSSAPVVYVPYFQQTPLWQGPSAQFIRGGMFFLLRSAGDPINLVPSVRSAVAEVDPNRPLTAVQTLEQFLGDQLEETRLFTALLGIFGAIAVVLAAVGLYGVIAYTVAERGKEIGIRIALGAAAPSILKLVMRQALAIIGIGLGVGLVGAFALTRLLSSVLWGVTPTDPVTFVAVTAMLVAVALLACVVPTVRALAVDPAATLRNN